ncbi:MAG: hypothetical protein OXF93_23105 [Acidobacteria bacterium]|nr:hypothetical protein [Acidobacteriota bacterium]
MIDGLVKLPRNVQFMYKEQLARVEARALGCEGWDRDDDDPWQIQVDVNGIAADVLRRATYVGELDGESTVHAELIRPQYQGGLFNRTRSTNQYLTHWIYPYRGKFHPQLVRALLNIVGARANRLCEETQDPQGQPTGREHRAAHPADEARFEVRNLGTDAGDLRREPRVEGSDLRPHLGDLRSDLGEAGLELIGRDVIALLGGHTDGVRDGVGLGRRELGVSERASGRRRACRA